MKEYATRTALLTVMLLMSATGTLAETLSFSCLLTAEASPEGVDSGVKPFELRFIVDSAAGKAYLMGNQGSSEVFPVWGQSGVTFIEQTDTGNILTTTVVHSAVDESKVGTAIHSRNIVMSGLGEVLPSQWYGRCEIR